MLLPHLATAGDLQRSGTHRAALSDNELMRRMHADDAGTLAAVYDRHSASVYGLAFRMLRERSAEDVVQETFLALWRGRHGYRPELGSLRTWLLTVTRNRAIDAIRRARPGTLVEFATDHHGVASVRTDDEARRRLEAGDIGAALGCLPETQRETLELAFFGGLTQSEIAAHLQIPLGSVKGRTRLALRKLAAQLDPAAGRATTPPTGA